MRHLISLLVVVAILCGFTFVPERYSKPLEKSMLLLAVAGIFVQMRPKLIFVTIKRDKEVVGKFDGQLDAGEKSRGYLITNTAGWASRQETLPKWAMQEKGRTSVNYLDTNIKEYFDVFRFAIICDATITVRNYEEKPS